MNRIFTLIFSFLSLTLLAQDAFERTFQVGTADEIAYDALEWNNGYRVWCPEKLVEFTITTI